MNEYSVHCTFFSGKRHLLNQFSTIKFKNGIMKVSILEFNYHNIELLGGLIAWGYSDFSKVNLSKSLNGQISNTNTMVYRFPVQNNEIKMGAELTVRESQVAIFVNEGEIADVFGPGRHLLYTQNMPILTKLKSWKHGFELPF